MVFPLRQVVPVEQVGDEVRSYFIYHRSQAEINVSLMNLFRLVEQFLPEDAGAREALRALRLVSDYVQRKHTMPPMNSMTSMPSDLTSLCDYYTVTDPTSASRNLPIKLDHPLASATTIATSLTNDMPDPPLVSRVGPRLSSSARDAVAYRDLLLPARQTSVSAQTLKEFIWPSRATQNKSQGLSSNSSHPSTVCEEPAISIHNTGHLESNLSQAPQLCSMPSPPPPSISALPNITLDSRERSPRQRILPPEVLIQVRKDANAPNIAIQHPSRLHTLEAASAVFPQRARSEQSDIAEPRHGTIPRHQSDVSDRVQNGTGSSSSIRHHNVVMSRSKLLPSGMRIDKQINIGQSSAPSIFRPTSSLQQPAVWDHARSQSDSVVATRAPRAARSCLTAKETCDGRSRAYRVRAVHSSDTTISSEARRAPNITRSTQLFSPYEAWGELSSKLEDSTKGSISDRSSRYFSRTMSSRVKSTGRDELTSKVTYSLRDKYLGKASGRTLRSTRTDVASFSTGLNTDGYQPPSLSVHSRSPGMELAKELAEVSLKAFEAVPRDNAVALCFTSRYNHGSKRREDGKSPLLVSPSPDLPPIAFSEPVNECSVDSGSDHYSSSEEESAEDGFVAQLPLRRKRSFCSGITPARKASLLTSYKTMAEIPYSARSS